MRSFSSPGLPMVKQSAPMPFRPAMGKVAGCWQATQIERMRLLQRLGQDVAFFDVPGSGPCG